MKGEQFTLRREQNRLGSDASEREFWITVMICSKLTCSTGTMNRELETLRVKGKW